MTRRFVERWAPVLIWAALALLFFSGIRRGIWTPDEPREAGIGREMFDHPGFIPSLDGKPFYEKPPLYYWTLDAAFHVAGGPSVPAARAVSVLSCLLVIAVTYGGLRRAAGPGPALAAALILATSLGFFRSSQWILLDPLLALWMTLAFWGAFECLASGSAAGWIVMLVGLSLAIWTKGLIGAVFFLPGWAAFAWLRRREGVVRRFRPAAAAVVLAAAGLGCLAGFWIAGGRAALVQFLWVNHVERFLHPVTTGHAEPWSYYLRALPVALLPWSLLLPAILRPSYWRRAVAAEKPLLRPFLGWTVLGGLLLLTAASTKRETYLLPLLPLLASLLGLAVNDAIRSAAAERNVVQRMVRYVHPWVPALWALLPPLAVWFYLGSLDVAGAAFLVAGGIVAAGAVVASLGRSASWAFRWQVCAALAGCAAISMLVIPALDPVKNLEPFVQRLNGAIPGGQSVVALSADETLYGIIPFVTGRRVVGLTEDEFVDRALSGKRPTYVVEQEDPEHRFPRDPHLLGYEVVMEDQFGPARSLRLWRDEYGPQNEVAGRASPQGRQAAKRG